MLWAFTEVSRRALSLNDVNYDDTNANVSPHHCLQIFGSIDRAHIAKNKSVIKGRWYRKGT